MNYAKIILRTADLQQVKQIILNNLDENVDRSLLEQLKTSRDSGVVAALAAWRNVPQEWMGDFVADQRYPVRVGAAKNPNIDHDSLEILSKDESPAVRISVATRQQLPADILDSMATSEKNEKVLFALSQRNDITDQQARAMRQNQGGVEDPRIKQNIIKNINMDVNNLQNLEDVEKIELAKKPNLPEQTVTLLAQDRNETVKAALAENPSVNSETLEVVYQNRGNSIKIKLALSKNPKISETVGLGLAGDQSQSVRYQLAYNTAATDNVLVRLIRHRDQRLNKYILMREDLSEAILEALQENSKEDVLIDLANRPNLPPNVFVALYRSPYMSVREIMSERPDAPEELKAYIRIYKKVKSGEMTPEEYSDPANLETIKILLQEQDPQVVDALIGADSETIENLICDGINSYAKVRLLKKKQLDEEKQVQLAKTGDETVLMALTKQATIHPETAVHIAKTASEHVKILLIDRGNLSQSVLDILKNDPSYIVRQKIGIFMPIFDRIDSERKFQKYKDLPIQEGDYKTNIPYEGYSFRRLIKVLEESRKPGITIQDIREKDPKIKQDILNGLFLSTKNRPANMEDIQAFQKQYEELMSPENLKQNFDKIKKVMQDNNLTEAEMKQITKSDKSILQIPIDVVSSFVANNFRELQKVMKDNNLTELTQAAADRYLKHIPKRIVDGLFAYTNGQPASEEQVKEYIKQKQGNITLEDVDSAAADYFSGPQEGVERASFTTDPLYADSQKDHKLAAGGKREALAVSLDENMPPEFKYWMGKYYSRGHGIGLGNYNLGHVLYRDISAMVGKPALCIEQLQSDFRGKLAEINQSIKNGSAQGTIDDVNTKFGPGSWDKVVAYITKLRAVYPRMILAEFLRRAKGKTVYIANAGTAVMRTSIDPRGAKEVYETVPEKFGFKPTDDIPVTNEMYRDYKTDETFPVQAGYLKLEKASYKNKLTKVAMQKVLQAQSYKNKIIKIAIALSR